MNRRKFLTAVGTAATTAIAGCGGTSSKKSKSQDEPSSSDPLDSVVFNSVSLESTDGGPKVVFTIDPNLVPSEEFNHLKFAQASIPKTDFVKTQRLVHGHAKYSFIVPKDANMCRLLVGYSEAGENGLYRYHEEVTVKLTGSTAEVVSSKKSESD